MSGFIETVGTVKAETKIDIVSLVRGTTQGIFFDVGDNVTANMILASLYDSSSFINLNNARTNYSNLESNLYNTERLSEESIRQAENGIQSAQRSIEAEKRKEQLESVILKTIGCKTDGFFNININLVQHTLYLSGLLTFTA